MPSLAALALMATVVSEDEARPVTFRFSDGAAHESVVVVGGFNEWDRARNPLTPDAERKVWTGTFRIPIGAYPYLFCVDNRSWVRDPAAPTRPDGNGNVNSLLIVAPEDYDIRPARPGDGHVTASALRHRPDARDTIRYDRETVGVRVRTRKDDVARVTVRSGGRTSEGERLGGDELHDEWWVAFRSPRDGRYRIEADGVEVGTFRQAFARYALPRPPAWLRDAVFYQIFPERFASGDPANDGPDVQPWGSTPTPRGRMGGDLAGIRANLGRLEAIGANALYLNPVFASPSNHAYDTDDYERVDSRFGTNGDLKGLVGELHRRGMRVILDGVFNHSSPEFFAFRDLRSRGAESPFRDWYHPLAFPIVVGEGQRTYRTFAGVPNMPKLNQETPAARDYFVGIGRKWIREAGVDGWRLDVADEIHPSFLRAFRKGVRAARRDAYLLGETWGDAHEMIQGDAMDASMNYRWRRATLDLVNRRITPTEYARALREIDATTPVEARWATFNLLGSHDTERLRTAVGGSAARHKLAAAIQFFSPGVPCVYYGDEYGLEGGKEPASRNAMPTSPTAEQTELAAFYRRLSEARGALADLRSRDPVDPVAPGSGRLLLAYGREGSGVGRLLANLSDRAVDEQVPSGLQILVGDGYRREGERVTLAPDGFVIYRTRNGAKAISTSGERGVSGPAPSLPPSA